MNRKSTIVDVVHQYILERDLSYGYRHQLLSRIRSLCDHVGYDPPPAKVVPETINSWLACLARRAETVCGYRRAIITVLNYSADLGLRDYPTPRRIRRPKITPKPPVAFTVDQVGKLIGAAGQLAGCFPDGTPRARYMQALIATAYDTGLRRADLFDLPRDVVTSDTVGIVQQKTGYLIVVGVRPETRAMIQELHGERPLRWRLHINNDVRLSMKKVDLPPIWG